VQWPTPGWYGWEWDGLGWPTLPGLGGGGLAAGAGMGQAVEGGAGLEMLPLKVSRSTMAAHRRGLVKVYTRSGHGSGR
jgi:hypothetical protein